MGERKDAPLAVSIVIFSILCSIAFTACVKEMSEKSTEIRCTEEKTSYETI